MHPSLSNFLIFLRMLSLQRPRRDKRYSSNDEKVVSKNAVGNHGRLMYRFSAYFSKADAVEPYAVNRETRGRWLSGGLLRINLANVSSDTDGWANRLEELPRG